MNNFTAFGGSLIIWRRRKKKVPLWTRGGAGRSKNAISQVASYELKILNTVFQSGCFTAPQPHPPPSPPQLYSIPHHTQCFVTEGRLPSNLMKNSAGKEKKERKKERKIERGKKSASRSGHRPHDPHILPPAPRSPHHAANVI